MGTFIIAILKSIAAMATMAFGLYGLGVDLRHREGPEKGHLTREGLIVLAGVVVSGMLAIAVIGADSYFQQQDSLRREANAYTLLKEVRNGSYSMRDMRLRFEIEMLSQQSTTYLGRVKSALDKINTVAKCRAMREEPFIQTVPMPERPPDAPKGVICFNTGAPRPSVSSFLITQDSDLFPGNGLGADSPNEVQLRKVVLGISAKVGFSTLSFKIDKNGELQYPEMLIVKDLDTPPNKQREMSEELKLSHADQIERKLFYDRWEDKITIELRVANFKDNEGRQFNRSLVEFQGGSIVAAPWMRDSCRNDRDLQCEVLLEIVSGTVLRSFTLELPYRKSMYASRYQDERASFKLPSASSGLLIHLPVDIDGQ